MPIYVKADKVKSDHIYVQFPITINDNTDSSVPEWGLFGAGSQSGTPTPDSPIMPTFCGVRTGNLFDGVLTGGYYRDTFMVQMMGDETVFKSFKIFLPAGTYTLHFDIKVSFVRAIYDNTLYQNPALNVYAFTVQTTTDGYVGFSFRDVTSSTTPWDDTTTIMFNTGTTALPYEPYGWAEKITCAGQTTHVYLGEVPTIRRIRKLVLDGTENMTKAASNPVFTLQIGSVYPPINDNVISTLSTHYQAQANASGTGNVDDGRVCIRRGYSTLYIGDTRYDNVTDFKTWVATQYANGTPVTIWYVLAEPTTSIIDEPLAKIGDYADVLSNADAGVSLSLQTGTPNTISVESDLQPSKMNISYYSEGYTDVKKIPMSNPITVTKTSFPAIIKNNLTSGVDSYVIMGNGSQTGTPSPDNIIMPTFCGTLSGSDWTIPITCAGQTVPVYLGQTPTVRRVQKLVLTGEETSWHTLNGFMYNDVIQPDYLRSEAITMICSHYKAIGGVAAGSEISNGQCALYRFASVQRIYIRDDNFTTINNFKSYLAAQYAAGTPVTVWYVLAEPQTAIVNEPLCKIGNYADELHSSATDAPVLNNLSTDSTNSISFDSTIQPSSMSLTYKAEVDKVLSSNGTAVYLSSRQ